MKKRSVTIILLCMILVFVISACSSPGGSTTQTTTTKAATQTTTTAGGTTTVTTTQAAKNPADFTGKVVNWQMNAGAERNAVYEHHIVEFNKIYPNITVELSHFPSAEALKKIELAAASDDMPDTFDLAAMNIPPFAIRGSILALDDFIENWEAKDEILPVLLEGTRNYVPDGKIYYIPGNAQLGILWYRADLFDAPKTWDDFYKIAEEYTDNDTKTYGFSIRGVAGVTNALSFMFSYSGITEFFDENGNCTVNDPLHVESMEKYYSMYKVYTPESDITNNFKEMTAVFGSGVAMMILHNTGSYVDHLKNLGEGKFAAARMPKPINGEYLVDIEQAAAGYLLGKNKNANYESAFELIAYFSEFDAQNYRHQLIGTVPTNIRVYEEDWTKKMAHYELVMESLTSPNTKLVALPIYLPDYNKILNDIGDKGFQNVMMGNTNVKQVLDDMAVAFEKAYAEYLEMIKN